MQRVMVWSKWLNFDKTWVSSQEVFDYRELASTMTDVAFWANTFQNLTDAGEPVRLNVGLVGTNTFDVLGTRPLLGRKFTADDERSSGAPVACSATDCGSRSSGAIAPSSAAASCSTTCQLR